jgi:hypothetical protein
MQQTNASVREVGDHRFIGRDANGKWHETGKCCVRKLVEVFGIRPHPETEPYAAGSA